MTKITFAGNLSTLIVYGVLLSRKNMSVTIDYSALHLETLEIILLMHEKDYLELLENPAAQPEKILNLESAIQQVTYAISIKKQFSDRN